MILRRQDDHASSDLTSHRFLTRSRRVVIQHLKQHITSPSYKRFKRTETEIFVKNFFHQASMHLINTYPPSRAGTLIIQNDDVK